MISPISRLEARGHTSAQCFADVFRQVMHGLEQGTQRYRIPRLYHLYEPHADMPYHFKPELFIQVSGRTEFSFPDEAFTLHPGEVCVVPKGMPHGERARSEEAPFENIVVSFYNDLIDVHVAHEDTPGVPRAVEVNFYTTEFFRDMVSYLDSVCEFHHRNARVNTPAIKGLLLAEFALLLTLVEASSSHLASTTDTVALCQWLIQHNLQDESLGVESLAAELDCSPNYLSKYFHRKTGERITERINRLRIQNAVDALRWTRLSVKSIAAGCGYSGSNYFCRLFRQATGRSPQQYRHDLRRIASALEKPAPAPTGRLAASAPAAADESED